jgi:hypothetical protein
MKNNLVLKTRLCVRSKPKASLRNFVPIFLHFRYHFDLAIRLPYSEKHTWKRKRKIKQHTMETLKNIFYFFVSQWLGCISTRSSHLILQVEALQPLHKYPRPTQYENQRTWFEQLQTSSKHEVGNAPPAI